MPNDAKIKMLKTNEAQARFYNSANALRITNLPMRSWQFFRRRMYFLMKHADLWNDVFALHKEWIGDLSNKRVLDLGCYEGNALSIYLAQNSHSYLGIDLSDQALNRLADRFKKRGITGARVKCVDALSREFTDTGFDLVYAQGVLHHFKPIDEILSVLQDKLVPGGSIVSFDPLQTSALTRSIRLVYHPFRSDKEWEWPFRRDTFDTIQKYFTIVEMQGVLGRSKWATPLAFISKPMAIKAFQRLHRSDIHLAKSADRHLWGCMQVALCLEKRFP